MKRITFDGNFCDIAACMEVPGGSWCEGVMCSQRAVWERLKAIEDVLGDEYDLDRLRMAVAVQSMTPNEYQQLCLRTINQDTPSDQLLINCALGLCGEAGEVSDIIKKYLFQGHPLNADKIADELGDVGWYHAVMAWALGIPLEDIMQANVDKMRRRLPGRVRPGAQPPPKDRGGRADRHDPGYVGLHNDRRPARGRPRSACDLPHDLRQRVNRCGKLPHPPPGRC